MVGRSIAQPSAQVTVPPKLVCDPSRCPRPVVNVPALPALATPARPRECMCCLPPCSLNFPMLFPPPHPTTLTRPRLQRNTEFGYSRKDVILIGAGLIGAGYALYYGLQVSPLPMAWQPAPAATGMHA